LWAGDWEEDPGDEEILAKAHDEGRVLVTLDKDFGELAVVRRIPHSGIVRLVNFPARQQGRVALQIIAHYAEELRSGAIITVDSRRIRVRPPYEEKWVRLISSNSTWSWMGQFSIMSFPVIFPNDSSYSLHILRTPFDLGCHIFFQGADLEPLWELPHLRKLPNIFHKRASPLHRKWTG
jgi:predicted nuclease of predicted toxin-antitoxin system